MKKSIIILFSLCLGPYFKSCAQDSMGGGHERWEYILEGTGDVLQFALPLSAGIMTLVKKDYKGTKRMVLSLGTSMAVTYSLKYMVNKKRPEERNLYDSFPSGHTASAFSGASFIQRRYGWKYGWPAYVLAGIVGVSRMEGPDGYHDIWDVLGGAAIGIGSTYLFTKPYQQEKMNLGFETDGEHYVLIFKYKF